MKRSHGFQIRVAIPVVDSEGELFSLREWNWWTDKTLELMRVLEASHGPWTTRSVGYVWTKWTLVNNEQLNTLLESVDDAREHFRTDALYVEYFPITFILVAGGSEWRDAS